MARKEVSSEVTGNPFITGIYAEEEGLAFEGKIKLTLTNSGVGEGSWSYTLSGLDAEGNELTKTDNLPINSTETSATILGVNIDVSQVKNLQGDATWTYEFQAEGLKSSDEAFIGNGSNALKMAEVKDTMLNYGGSLTDVQSYYQGMIGELGDRASEANRMTQVAGVLQESVGQNRMSMSSVSLDEEMADMIKFQHAYNAAARYVTLVDELLDKIINGMGVVGR
jgi:flagellar hook-associated protein 1 FlgK